MEWRGCLLQAHMGWGDTDWVEQAGPTACLLAAEPARSCN